MGPGSGEYTRERLVRSPTREDETSRRRPWALGQPPGNLHETIYETMRLLLGILLELLGILGILPDLLGFARI